MNMHVTNIGRAATSRAVIRSATRPANDRTLIVLCLYAVRLFGREKAAERRWFALVDANVSDDEVAEATGAAMDRAHKRLRAVLDVITNMPALTGEGMAYKAGLLGYWIDAGFGESEHELARSIADDAKRVGLMGVTYANSQRRRRRH